MEQSGASAMDLFNGVSTHFLSECPGQGSQESVEDVWEVEGTLQDQLTLAGWKSTIYNGKFLEIQLQIGVFFSIFTLVFLGWCSRVDLLVA